MLPAILAGLGSFAIAKLSGASTRNALISGLLGGTASFGVSKLAGIAKAGSTAVGATGAGATTATTLGQGVQAGIGSTEALAKLAAQQSTVAAATPQATGLTGFLTKQFSENPELASQVAAMGEGFTKYNTMYPALIGAATTKFDPYDPQFEGISDQDSELRAELYAKQKSNLEGITTPREYTTAESQYSVPYRDIVFAKEGGIINALPKFNQGGVSYLPSKIDHDEKDINNYVRAQGYVEDGSGNGDKDEDTMLAQLADGEFVSRADAILGAGIMAGANPEDFKEMRKKGATFFYNQQDQFKRVYDLLNAN